MNASPSISDLRFRRSELTAHRDYVTALPLQVEILRLLEDQRGSSEDIANAHNYLSVLYARTKDYPSAEVHARHALAYHSGDSLRDHERSASYHMVLARILKLREQDSEAITHAEIAISEWSIVHNPPDNFLKRIVDEVDAMKRRVWRNTFERE